MLLHAAPWPAAPTSWPAAWRPPPRVASVVSLEDDFDEDGLFWTDRTGRIILSAALIGAFTGLAVALFKTSIAATGSAFYASNGVMPQGDAVLLPAVLIPAIGGMGVAACRAVSPGGKLGPGLAEHVVSPEAFEPPALRPC